MKLKKTMSFLLSLVTLIIPLTTWADIVLSTGSEGIGVPDTNWGGTDPEGNSFIPVGIPKHSAWAYPMTGTNWIGPTDGNIDGLAGWYVYTYQFTLNSICDASIEGYSSSDNGLQIFFNGNQIFDSVDPLNPGQETTYHFFYPFSASSGFLVGTNTLTFRVLNGEGPTSLDVNALINTCPDTDGDNVDDATDKCPFTPPGEVVDVTGCSVTQYCNCDSNWKNHGDYVTCVVFTSRNFVQLGLLTQDERDIIVSEAGKSSCGHKKK
jgi:hypothetical protein